MLTLSCFMAASHYLALAASDKSDVVQMVMYARQPPNSTESWIYLAKGLNGPDSFVNVTFESCLSSEDICDSFCGTKRITHRDEFVEIIPEEESDFHRLLRFSVNVLDAFPCMDKPVESCTAEASYAKKMITLNEQDWDEIEEELSTKLYDYRGDKSLDVTVRRWVIVQSLLAKKQHERQRTPTKAEENFIRFMKAGNAYLGPTVWPVNSKEGNIRGVIVDRHVRPGDVLYSGRSLHITTSLARAYLDPNNTLEIPDSNDDDWGEFFQFVTFLALQAELGEISRIEPYITMLRENVDRGVFGWTEEELNELGDDTFVKGLEQIKQLQHKYFVKWGDALHVRKDKWHFDVYQWAFHVVTSRTFDFDEKALIPFVDMFNHHPQLGQDLQFDFRADDGALIVRAGKAIRRGEEIFIKYNDDLAHLLYAYGFVPKVDGCPNFPGNDGRAASINYYKCARDRYRNRV